MIACVTAVLLQISSVISRLVCVAQRNVLSSHLIEYAPYAITDGFSRGWRVVRAWFVVWTSACGSLGLGRAGLKPVAPG